METKLYEKYKTLFYGEYNILVEEYNMYINTTEFKNTGGDDLFISRINPVIYESLLEMITHYVNLFIMNTRNCGFIKLLRTMEPLFDKKNYDKYIKTFLFQYDINTNAGVKQLILDKFLINMWVDTDVCHNDKWKYSAFYFLYHNDELEQRHEVIKRYVSNIEYYKINDIMHKLFNGIPQTSFCSRYGKYYGDLTYDMSNSLGYKSDSMNVEYDKHSYFYHKKYIPE